MQGSINPGRFDWVVLFYTPANSKDAIGGTNTAYTTTSRKIKAERVFKSATERMDAAQQVGNTMLSFRMPDVRKTGFLITQEWEFDAYPISKVALSKRFRVRGIEDEGRRNYIIVTGETRDNG